MTTRPALFVATLFIGLPIAGCPAPASPHNDSGGGPVDAMADTMASGEGGADVAQPMPDATDDLVVEDAPVADDGTTSGGDSAVATDVPGDATGPADSGATDAAVGCNFEGRWHVSNITCNGMPFSRMAAITPPSGSFTSVIHAAGGSSFTEDVLGCALTEHGRFRCDAPSAGEFTVDMFMPDTCAPAGCMPFSSQCGTTPTRTDVWTYMRVSATEFIATSTPGTMIATCTGAGQMNPIQVTWVYDGP